MKNILIFISVIICFASCKDSDPENPYDLLPVINQSNPDPDDLPEGNFAWLQAKIFKPTCANSGCHDGTFEPEFNTIASSYNSLVNHPVITNDEAGTFTYRVVPNNPDLSLLIERLTNFIPNTSGIMPLEVDGDSDWLDNDQVYIQKIKDWINQGAKDMYGNPAPSTDADFPPQADGFVVFPSGNTSTPYERDPEEVGISPILVDAAPLDLWIRISDDNTSVTDMNTSTLKFSEDVNGFDVAIDYPYTVESPISALDFADSPASFYHKASIDLSSYSTGDVFFIRNYLDDFQQLNVTELPNDGSNAVITALFMIEIQ